MDAKSGESLTSLGPVLGPVSEAQSTAATHALDKQVKDMERVRKQAAAAAQRLIQARDPDLPLPKTREAFLDLIEYMAKNSRKYGVTLSNRDKRCIIQWHVALRLSWTTEAKA